MYHAARRRPVLLRTSVERQPAGRDREIYRRGPDGCEQTEHLNRMTVYIIKVEKESGCEQTEYLNRMAVYIIRWERKTEFRVQTERNKSIKTNNVQKPKPDENL